MNTDPIFYVAFFDKGVQIAEDHWRVEARAKTCTPNTSLKEDKTVLNIKISETK